MMDEVIKQLVYDKEKNRLFPKSPYWATADAGNQFPLGSPQRTQAKLMAPTESMIMAGLTGPGLKRNMDQRTMNEVDGLLDYFQGLSRGKKVPPAPNAIKDADAIASEFLPQKSIDKVVAKNTGKDQASYYKNLIKELSKKVDYDAL